MATSKSKHVVEISAVDNATKTIKGIESSFSRLGAFIGGSAVVGALTAATTAAMNFEKGLAKTATLLPKASRDMTQFADGLRRIRLQGLGGSLTELTDGLYETVSAGVPAGKAVAFLEVAAKAAKGGFTDMRTSVDGLTTVLNAYRMETEEAGKVADILFTAQNRGKTTFGEMAGTLGQLLPIASSTGAHFEEIAAALSTLTIQGIPTAIAITGLRATIAAFIEKGDGGKIATLGLSGALKDLEEKTGGNQKKLQDYLGRVEALNTVLALTGKNAGQFASDLDAMKSSAGAADDAVKTFSNNVAGLVEKWRALVEVSTTSFGGGFLEGISSQLPDPNNTLKQAQAFEALGRAIGGLVNILAYAPSKFFEGLQMIGTFAGHYFGQIRTGQAPGFLNRSNPGTLPMSPLARESYGASMFIGPMPLEHVAQNIAKGGDDIAEALREVARRTRRYMPFEDPYGERGVSGVLGQEFGMFTPRTGGIFDRNGNPNVRGRGQENPAIQRARDIQSEIDKANQSYDQFITKVQAVSGYVMSAMSSITQSIVRGIEQGTLRIKDLFNALKSAVLQIIADLAARLATAGILSLLFPSLGFGNALGGVFGGGFGGRTNSVARPAPVGVRPGGSSFGGPSVVNHNYYIEGSLVTREQIARDVMNIGATQARRGQNGMSKFVR